MSEERMRILEMVAQGTINAEQAAQLIQALDDGADDEFDDVEAMFPEDVNAVDPVETFETIDEAPADEDDEVGHHEEEAARREPASESPEIPQQYRKYRSFWYIPLAIGVGITALSGFLVYAGNRADWHWFWMSCVWLPLLFGIVVMMMSAMSRTARWLHVRVNTGQDEWPRRIAISLPLPLRTAGWLMKVFGGWIPGLDDIPVPVGDAILALEKSLTPDDPLYVHVEDTDGEKVEVYIG